MSGPTKSQILIEAARLTIVNGNLSALSNLLGVMKLNLLSADRADDLLLILLETARMYNRLKSVSVILGAWNAVYPDIEKIPIYSFLYLNYKFDIDMLRFLALAHPDITFVEIISDLIGWDDSQITWQGCIHASNVYGPQSLSTYKFLLKLSSPDTSRSDGNVSVYNFIADKIRGINDYADVPDWIINQYEDIPNVVDIKPPKGEPISFALPSDDQIIDTLVSNMKSLDAYTSDTVRYEGAIRKLVTTASRQHKAELIKPFVEYKENSAKQSDEYLFRSIGPANLGSEGSDIRYGGCRMLTCDIYDYFEEDDEVYDWFTGSCDQCFLRIKYRWYAVRMPRPGAAGGWRGSYCSWKCCRNAVHELEDVEILTLAMIDIYEKHMLQIGIQEREPNQEHPDIAWAGQIQSKQA